MQNVPHYSETKLRAMSPQLLKATVDKLLYKLELSLSEADKCQAVIEELIKCSTLPNLPEEQQIIINQLKNAMDPHLILQIIVPYLDRQGKTRKDSQIPIRTGDHKRLADPVIIEKAARIVVVLDNLRSVFNVGSIFRTAECLGIKNILLCGITPTPLHPNLAKTAMGTTDHVPWKYYPHTSDAISELKQMGYNIYALETAETAESVFATAVSYPLALVLGNESLGIAASILELCDAVIDIPVMGWKNSLNVGVAFSVCAYQLLFGINSQ